MRVDLHTHTTCSDGLLTPAELVRRARDRGVAQLSITDHDTVDGVEEAARAAAGAGIELVPGIELTARAQGSEVHVLGYFVDPRSPRLAESLRRLRDRSTEQVRETIHRLRALGIGVAPERVAALAGGENGMRRLHIARVLVEAGRAPSVDEAFARYLGPGAPAHVPAERLSLEAAARLIREVGGVPVLAHPYRYGALPDVEGLITESLGGLEAYRPEHMPRQTLTLLDLARRRGLVASGGSDFHGDGMEREGVGALYVPPQTVEDLRKARPAAHEGPGRAPP